MMTGGILMPTSTERSSSEGYQPIEDYAIIGDLSTAALVGNNASIDFLCFPKFDSPSIFCANADWRNNPAAMLAVIKYLASLAKGKHIHVMMPYSNRLYLLADWYRQLWAESLGKRTTRDGREVFAGPETALELRPS